MEKQVMGWSFLALALATVIVSHQNFVGASITCDEVLTLLTPCKPFLLGKAPKPVPICCAGLKTVHERCSTPPGQKTVLDRCSTPANNEAMCECFKKGRAEWGVNEKKAYELPPQCGMTAIECKR